MSHSFIAYIDESGDDGLGNFREPGARGGSTTWLSISACLFRYSYELEAVSWRDEISAKMPEKRSRSIHFASMNHGQKTFAAQCLAKRPIRALSVVSNKKTIPQGIYNQKNQLYFYLTRYLIERLSWLCRDMRPHVPEGNGMVKIVFSRRGGMSYPDFKNYLDRLKSTDDPQIRIHWPVIDIPNIEAKDHSSCAGLQISDVIASAFTAALEPDRYGNCERRYAEILKPIVYNRKGNYLSYGLKIVPSPYEMNLTDQQTAALALFQ